MLAYAVAPEFDVPDFQVLSHDCNHHSNLVEFHSVAHDSFAKEMERKKVNILCKYQE